MNESYHGPGKQDGGVCIWATRSGRNARGVNIATVSALSMVNRSRRDQGFAERARLRASRCFSTSSSVVSGGQP